MPRSTREWAHRKIDEAYGNLDTAIAHLGEVAETYEKQHPEIAEPIMSIVAVIMEVEKALNGVGGSF